MRGLSSSYGYDQWCFSPEGAVEDNLAPKGAELGSSSAASMDVHVESPLVQSEERVLTSFPTALVGPVTLEFSEPGAGNPLFAVGGEVSMSVALGASSNPPLGFESALNIASASTPPFDSTSMLSALGFPLILSILQVS
jgi:hypothetical protein